MKLTGITPILNVSDVPASLAWFERLGWKRGFTYNAGGIIANAADRNASGPAGFAGVFCDGAGDTHGCQIFLCHDGQGSRGGPHPRHVTPGARDDDTGGVWMSWWLEQPTDVDAVHELALRHEITVTRPPTDEPWGVRECRIVHPDGHTIRVSAFTRG